MSNWRLLIVNFAGSSVKRRPWFEESAQKGTYSRRICAHRKLVAGQRDALGFPTGEAGISTTKVERGFKSPVEVILFDSLPMLGDGRHDRRQCDSQPNLIDTFWYFLILSDTFWYFLKNFKIVRINWRRLNVSLITIERYRLKWFFSESLLGQTADLRSAFSVAASTRNHQAKETHSENPHWLSVIAMHIELL